MEHLEQVTDQSLELTLQWIADIRRMMMGEGADPAIEAMTMLEKQQVTGLLAKLMRAATGLIKEARAMAKDAKEAAERLSYAEKRALVLQFVQMMPIEHQQELRVELGWHLVAS